MRIERAQPQVTITLPLDRWQALLDPRRVEEGLPIADHNRRAEAHNTIRRAVGAAVHRQAVTDRNARLEAMRVPA